MSYYYKDGYILLGYVCMVKYMGVCGYLVVNVYALGGIYEMINWVKY